MVDSQGRILIAGVPERRQAALLADLSKAGYGVEMASSEEEALEQAATGRFDCVLTEYMMPGADCDRLVLAIRSGSPSTQVIVIDADADTQTYLRLMNEGAFDYFQADAKHEHLLRQIERAVDRGLAART